MAVALTIRNVPDDVRDALAERAAQVGQSLQTFLLNLIEREARLASNVRMFDRTAHLRVRLPEGSAPEAIIREGRDGGLETDRERP